MEMGAKISSACPHVHVWERGKKISDSPEMHLWGHVSYLFSVVIDQCTQKGSFCQRTRYQEHVKIAVGTGASVAHERGKRTCSKGDIPPNSRIQFRNLPG